MPTTTNGLRHPAPSAVPNIPQDIQNLATDVDTLLLNPVMLRSSLRQANNVLTNTAQPYGSASAGLLVIPAASRTRLVRIDGDIDIWCSENASTAGTFKLYANGTHLTAPGNWPGTFQNTVGVNLYTSRPVTGHVRWEGRLPAAAQNIWVEVVADAASQPFWVTSTDLTVVYR